MDRDKLSRHLEEEFKLNMVEESNSESDMAGMEEDKSPFLNHYISSFFLDLLLL